MSEHTYVLTLVNDRQFYDAVLDDDYLVILSTANLLYNSYHAEDGLSAPDRLAAVLEGVNYILTD